MGTRGEALDLMERCLGYVKAAELRQLIWKLNADADSGESLYLHLFLALRRHYAIRCSSSTVYSAFVQEVAYMATKVN